MRGCQRGVVSTYCSHQVCAESQIQDPMLGKQIEICNLTKDASSPFEGRKCPVILPSTTRVTLSSKQRIISLLTYSDSQTRHIHRTPNFTPSSTYTHLHKIQSILILCLLPHNSIPFNPIIQHYEDHRSKEPTIGGVVVSSAIGSR